MICVGCANAADEGYKGVVAHYYGGCPAITKVGGEYIVDRTICDCQHRDDIPEKELMGSEV